MNKLPLLGTNILLMEEIRLTTWHVKNHVNNGINYLSTGAGVLPSTVSPKKALSKMISVGYASSPEGVTMAAGALFPSTAVNRKVTCHNVRVHASGGFPMCEGSAAKKTTWGRQKVVEIGKCSVLGESQLP